MESAIEPAGVENEELDINNGSVVEAFSTASVLFRISQQDVDMLCTMPDNLLRKQMNYLDEFGVFVEKFRGTAERQTLGQNNLQISSDLKALHEKQMNYNKDFRTFIEQVPLLQISDLTRFIEKLQTRAAIEEVKFGDEEATSNAEPEIPHEDEEVDEQEPSLIAVEKAQEINPEEAVEDHRNQEAAVVFRLSRSARRRMARKAKKAQEINQVGNLQGSIQKVEEINQVENLQGSNSMPSLIPVQMVEEINQVGNPEQVNNNSAAAEAVEDHPERQELINNEVGNLQIKSSDEREGSNSILDDGFAEREAHEDEEVSPLLSSDHQQEPSLNAVEKTHQEVGNLDVGRRSKSAKKKERLMRRKKEKEHKRFLVKFIILSITSLLLIFFIFS